MKTPVDDGRFLCVKNIRQNVRLQAIDSLTQITLTFRHDAFQNPNTLLEHIDLLQ
jgi:hypothetical protein